MNAKQSLVLGASFGAGCLLAALLLGPRGGAGPAATAAEPVVPPTKVADAGPPKKAEVETIVPPKPLAPGRYQIVSVGGNAPGIVVLDTTTGHCWAHDTRSGPDDWKDLGTPTNARK